MREHGRIKTGNATVMQCPEVLRLATIAGAEALGMGDEIGSIEPGKRADLQMTDYRRFGLTPTLDPVQNSSTTPIRRTWRW